MNNPSIKYEGNRAMRRIEIAHKSWTRHTYRYFEYFFLWFLEAYEPKFFFSSIREKETRQKSVRKCSKSKLYEHIMIAYNEVQLFIISEDKQWWKNNTQTGCLTII